MKIILKDILTKDKTLEYGFSVSLDLKRYFSGKPLIIEYPDSIERVPKSVLAIPFVCNVLPIIWMTDSLLELDEIDKAFYDSIPEFKKGYIQMYPNAEFKGDIKATKIVENSYPDEKKSAMFYSGGLDSASTLISHLDEKPVLLSIWGSDIKYDNKEGWDLVHSAITEASERFGLEEYVFHSSFREFDNEGELDSEFSKVLGDGWWHGVKHGIGLLGNAVPFLYLKKISKLYFASSFSPAYGFHTCASDPSIDNYVKFCSCSVFHDGYEFSRQDKIHNVVDFSKREDNALKLHVCWESQDGNNCCHCEKCYRTICGIWAEGEDPLDYGFFDIEEKLRYSQECVITAGRSSYLVPTFYPEIQNVAKNNFEQLKTSKYYKDLKWVLKTDFYNLESNKNPSFYRVRRHLSNKSFYQKLHNLKMKIKGK